MASGLRLGFLASGNGSSARAICEAARKGELKVEPRLLVSNRRDTKALAWAQAEGLATELIPTLADPEAADKELTKKMQDQGINLVILSGYLRHLGPSMLSAFSGRMLNIHPGPLPEFGGEGMYGRRVHEAVIAAGVDRSAIVIHGLDEVYDRGPELVRQWVNLHDGETAETLEARVTALEPEFFVATLDRISRGELRLAGDWI